MADPILDAHQVAPSFFILSGPLAPISIRDQMLRGQWLIERLFEEGLIVQDVDGRPLDEFQVVIVGAGAAGVTAAMTAANGRASALVIERTSGPFLRQAASRTRWLDPTQYDWPASWTAATYPTVGIAPLFYSADRAARLALRWSVQWQLALRRFPRLLQVQYGTTAASIRPTFRPSPKAPSLALTLSNGRVVYTRALIWAAGFGAEKCEIVNQRQPGNVVKFVGVPFWGNDLLEQPSFGLSNSNPKLAILGAGDGAIQDALRALTKEKSTADIYHALKLPADFGRVTLEAEGQAHRHWVWAGRNGRRDHDLHTSLDRVHRTAAADALAIPSVKAAAEALIRHPNEEIAVYHRCDHLVCFYALNRFLAHLFNALIQERHSRVFLVGSSSVADADAMGTGWNLDIVDHPICYHPISLASPARFELADYIVVRYGIDPSSSTPPWPLRIDLTRNRHSFPSNPVLL